MKTIIEHLKKNPQVSDYKINLNRKESFELFFVKGRLETARCTDSCDRQVTIYVNHGDYKGDSPFFVYPSTTEAQLDEKIEGAVRNALLIENKPYELPGKETGEFQVASNFEGQALPELAMTIADAVFGANTLAHGSLNSVEVFLNRHTDHVVNSRGLDKIQHRYTAMVEAIPTYNGETQSVELYEQYNFSSLSLEALTAEIARKMQEVQARYEAVTPDFSLDCPVVLQKQELHDLFSNFAGDLNYSTVYGHGNLFHKGDRVQTEPTGDRLTLTMKGAAEGNIKSTSFDGDGMSLGEITLIRDGLVENYYGSNRFGQYLGETPTGNLGCLCVAPGSAKCADLEGKAFLEVISMSGLQVDFFNDYIGGEIRLARYYDGKGGCTPVTGVSISGKLKEVLNHIRLSADTDIHDAYMGPAAAILSGLKIF